MSDTDAQQRAIKAANGVDDLTWFDWVRVVDRSIVEGAKVVGRAVVDGE